MIRLNVTLEKLYTSTVFTEEKCDILYCLELSDKCILANGRMFNSPGRTALKVSLARAQRVRFYGVDGVTLRLRLRLFGFQLVEKRQTSSCTSQQLQRQ